MNATAANTPRTMPKGGRKGGTSFPRVALKDALVHAKKLVTKTHVASQPKDVIYSGVVGAKSGIGNIRVSALKQYGFMKGDEASGYIATELAKKIISAPPDELPALLQEAVLKPTVFKSLFQTFHGDTVNRAKLKQRAADLKVHPDETESCVDTYLSGMSTAKLVSIDGDKVTHFAPAAATTSTLPSVGAISEGTHKEDGTVGDETVLQGPGEVATGAASSLGQAASGVHNTPKAVFHVNVTLDSSLDIEKLAKQLELLKRFGAI